MRGGEVGRGAMVRGGDGAGAGVAKRWADLGSGIEGDRRRFLLSRRWRPLSLVSSLRRLTKSSQLARTADEEVSRPQGERLSRWTDRGSRTPRPTLDRLPHD